MRRLIKIYDIMLRDGTQGDGVSCSTVSASRSSRPGEGVDR